MTKILIDEAVVGFDEWWHNEGSQAPKPTDDMYEHCKRMCEIAWASGAYKALEQPAPPECKYGNEPASCRSSPMDCQCEIDAFFEQPAQQEPVAGLHAVYFRNNWDGEGDLEYVLAHLSEEGEWTLHENGAPLIEFIGDEIIKTWPLTFEVAPPPAPAQPIAQAVQTLIKAMQDDPEYAWSWHCNIAMAFVDAGGDRYTANQGAARFLELFARVQPAHELPTQPAQQEPVAIPEDVRSVAKAMQENGYRGPLAWAQAVIDFVADYTTPPARPAREPLTMQPIVTDAHGVLRFKKNAIVEHLLDTHQSADMNSLHCMDFTNEDRQQFAQLIGYSVSGYGDLSYVTDEAYEAAEKAAHGITKGN